MGITSGKVENKGGSHIEHVIQVADVADGQSKDFDFRKFLVGWQSGQKMSELSECHVECLDSDSLPGRMGHSILCRSSSPSSPLLSAQFGQFWIELRFSPTLALATGLAGSA